MHINVRRSITAACCVSSVLLLTAPAIGLTIPAGQDCMTTPCGGGTTYDFSGAGSMPPIPADFFGPGSDPFTGTIDFGGPGDFPGDTLVDRLADADLTSGSATVPIQIVELKLVSCMPITVMNGGQPELWDVSIGLSGPQVQGEMTIYQTIPEGGTFDSTLPVDATLTFTPVTPGPMPVTLPAGPMTLEANAVPWRTDTLGGITCTPGFTPMLCGEGTNLCCVISCHHNPSGEHPHCVTTPDCEPCPPDPDCAPLPGGGAVPAVSDWGFAVMVLLLLAAGTIALRPKRRSSTA